MNTLRTLLKMCKKKLKSKVTIFDWIYLQEQYNFLIILNFRERITMYQI
ncbi:unnamed protein product [Paramecium sonneborni]|uniref:Uncharacterized protein n=1 Tax=Paramecium sonneborni TaxID=65129 RepID=A0A8S1LP04_9CILI|nr:unnamed protein product [Paramecium sonneborni]